MEMADTRFVSKERHVITIQLNPKNTVPEFVNVYGDLAGRYVKQGCRTASWESIPGLLKRFTNSGSVRTIHI